MRVAITGSSGLIGSALKAGLAARGHDPIAIVRGRPAPGEIPWDPGTGTLDGGRLVGIDAVVNLAGPSIAGHRWTTSYKRELRDTRVAATTLIAEAIAGISGGPNVLVSASGVNYYGESDTATFDETSPPGDGFLAQLCVDWEASTGAARDAGVRVAVIRTGIVLSADGGALAKMVPLFRLGLGGRFGAGRQWQSWIAIDDHVSAVIHLLEGSASGPINLTAPTPVTNREFTATLGRVLGRPAVIPIPKFGPSLVFGRELVDTLLYRGQRVLPAALEADGFEFHSRTVDAALRASLGRS